MIAAGGSPKTAPQQRDQLHLLLALARRAAGFYRPALVAFGIGLVAAVLFDRTFARSYKSEAVLTYRNPIRWSALGSESGESSRSIGPRIKESVYARSRLDQINKDLHVYPRLSEGDAILELRKKLTFHASGDVFELSFEARNADLAQAVLDRLIRDLIEENSKSQREQASLTRDFLESERERNDLELRRLEEATADFKVRHPEVALPGQTAAARATAARGAHPAGRAVDEPDRRKPDREAEGAYAAVHRQTQQLTERLSAEQAVRVAHRKDAETALLAAQKELADKLTQLTDQHPDVVAARRKVTVSEANLVRAIEAVDKGADSAIEERRALQTKTSETIQAGVPKRRPAGAPQTAAPEAYLAPVSADPAGVDAEWMRLSRSLGEARERQQQLEDKLFLAEMMLNAAGAHLALLERPYKPKHAQPPGHAVVLGGGGMGAVVLALLVALGLALFDDRLLERSDINRLGTVRLVETIKGPLDWSIPANAPNAGAPGALNQLLAPPTSAPAADFRVLRWRLIHFDDPHILVVASPLADEGSTVCAANLAMAMAEQGSARVLLVGLNSRPTEPARMMEVTAPAALQRRVETNDQKALVMREAASRSPTFIQVGELVRRKPGESIDGVAFAGAIRSLRDESYDYIVIDAPPVLGSSDANLIAEAADAVIVACRARRSQGAGLRRSLEQLTPLPVLGVVLLDA